MDEFLIALRITYLAQTKYLIDMGLPLRVLLQGKILADHTGARALQLGVCVWFPVLCVSLCGTHTVLDPEKAMCLYCYTFQCGGDLTGTQVWNYRGSLVNSWGPSAKLLHTHGNMESCLESAGLITFGYKQDLSCCVVQGKLVWIHLLSSLLLVEERGADDFNLK